MYSNVTVLKQLKNIIFFSLLLMTGWLVLPSCEETVGSKNLYQNRKIKIVFAVKNRGVIKDTSITRFSAVGIGAADSIYNKTFQITKASLELSQNSDSSQFIIVIDSTHDIITIRYKRQLTMVSEEQGFNTRFVLQSMRYSRRAIDTAYFLSTEVSNEVDKNMRLIIKKEAFTDTSKRY